MKVDLTEDFDAFYTATYRNLVGQIYAVCGIMAEAEDAVQEAYARAWQRWGKVSGYGEPEAWVRTVAYRISISAWRKAANRFTAHQRADSGAGALPELSPDRLALVGALRRISAEQRRAIVLYHLVGLSVEEIARETDAPVGTVKTRLARGRKALAPMVSEFADQPAGPAPDNGATTATSEA